MSACFGAYMKGDARTAVPSEAAAKMRDIGIGVTYDGFVAEAVIVDFFLLEPVCGFAGRRRCLRYRRNPVALRVEFHFLTLFRVL